MFKTLSATKFNIKNTKRCSRCQTWYMQSFTHSQTDSWPNWKKVNPAVRHPIITRIFKYVPPKNSPTSLLSWARCLASATSTTIFLPFFFFSQLIHICMPFTRQKLTNSSLFHFVQSSGATYTKSDDAVHIVPYRSYTLKREYVKHQPVKRCDMHDEMKETHQNGMLTTLFNTTTYLFFVLCWASRCLPENN